MKLPSAGVFRDHGGQPIRYKTVTEQVDGREVLRCYLDPHDAGQWSAFGCGGTRTAAIKDAIAAWNAYDTTP